MADLSHSNEYIRGWNIEKSGDNVFSGYQQTGPTFYFYAVTNHKIKDIESLKDGDAEVRIINFIINESIDDPLEMKVGFSYVSVENA